MDTESYLKSREAFTTRINERRTNASEALGIPKSTSRTDRLKQILETALPLVVFYFLSRRSKTPSKP